MKTFIKLDGKVKQEKQGTLLYVVTNGHLFVRNLKLSAQTAPIKSFFL